MKSPASLEAKGFFFINNRLHSTRKVGFLFSYLPFDGSQDKEGMAVWGFSSLLLRRQKTVSHNGKNS